MSVTFTMDALKPRERKTKSGKPAKPRERRPERPTITVQSRGEEVLVWIDCRAKWSLATQKNARALRDEALKLLGPLTLNIESGGYCNLIATGPRLAWSGEKRRAAMLRVVSTLKLAARALRTHSFATFRPTIAELGPGMDADTRRAWSLDLAAIVRTNDQEAAAKRDAKRAEREAKKKAREEAKAAKLAEREAKAASRRKAAA